MIIAAVMRPLQYNLRDPAAKDNSITHAAAAPSNLDAAITMRSAQTQLPNTIELYVQRHQKMSSCKRHWHDARSRNQRVNKRIEARTHEQPLIAEHRGGTDRGRNDRSRARRTKEVASIAGQSNFTHKNTRVRAPTFPPTQAHATFMQPLQCDLQPESQQTHRSTHA